MECLLIPSTRSFLVFLTYLIIILIIYTTETTLRKITIATNKEIESAATQMNPTSITEVEKLGESTIAHTTTEYHTIFTQIALEMPVYNDKDLQKMKKAFFCYL